MSILKSFGPLVAASILFIGASIGATAAPVGLKGAAGPQPGDCKAVAEQVIGANPVHARQTWETMVKAKYGQNWSRWPAAQNAAIAPAGSGAFVAFGKPCFTYPTP